MFGYTASGSLRNSRNLTSQVYPQDIQCVVQASNGLGAIYVGNKQASQNLRNLQRLGIGAVLTAARGIQISHPRSQVPYYKYVPAVDHQHFNIGQYFDESITFIDQARQRTNILVHCMAGISRSVALVIAYVMAKQGIGYQEAFQQIKRKRSIINPNQGFIQQLKQFESKTIKQRPRMKSPARNGYYSPRRQAKTSYSNYDQNRYFLSPTRKQYIQPYRQNRQIRQKQYRQDKSFYPHDLGQSRNYIINNDFYRRQNNRNITPIRNNQKSIYYPTSAKNNYPIRNNYRDFYH